MFSASAELYDLIYSSFKDHPAETAQLAALIRAAHPVAHRILDVACGTAEHAAIPPSCASLAANCRLPLRTRRT